MFYAKMPVGLHYLILINTGIYRDFPIMKFHENLFGSFQDITRRNTNDMAKQVPFSDFSLPLQQK
jgi:hypothetical protein